MLPFMAGQTYIPGSGRCSTRRGSKEKEQASLHCDLSQAFPAACKSQIHVNNMHKSAVSFCMKINGQHLEPMLPQH